MASLPHHLSASLHTNFLIKRSTALQYPSQLHSASSNFSSSIVGRKETTLPTKALPDSSLYFTAANSPGSSRNLSELVLVSGLMLLLYWLTNFVVPDFVMKNLRAKETVEGQEAQEMETPTTLDASNEATLQTSTRAKKRNPKKSSKV